MIKKVLPHLSIVISIMMIVLMVLNYINDTMGFLRGSEFEILLLIYCIISLIVSIMMVSINRKTQD